MFLVTWNNLFGLDWGLMEDLCQVTWYKRKKKFGLEMFLVTWSKRFWGAFLCSVDDTFVYVWI